jgi:hypothetical protein
LFSRYHRPPKPESLLTNNPHPISYDTLLLSELPFFSFEGPLTDKEFFQIEAFQSHIDQMIDFKEKNKNKFITIFLNINGIFNKCYETDEILKKVSPDAFLINETKLGKSAPASWYKNIEYQQLRLEREDGELAFIKKGTIIKKQEYTDFESIYFQLYERNTF